MLYRDVCRVSASLKSRRGHEPQFDGGSTRRRFAGSDAEVAVQHSELAAQRLGRQFLDDVAVVEDIDAVGEARCGRRVLPRYARSPASADRRPVPLLRRRASSHGKVVQT